MVEKVSEASVQGALTIDSAPDDGVLLEHIVKKKKHKQDGENNLSAAMLPPETLVRLTTAMAHGGGLEKTDKQAMKQPVHLSSGQPGEPRQADKGENLRRRVALALAGQTAIVNPDKKPAMAEKGEATRAVSGKETVVKHKAESLSAANMQVSAGTKLPLSVAARQSSAAQQSPATGVANPVNIRRSVPEAEPGHEGRQPRIKDESGEARPYWQGVKQAENVLPKQGETPAQSKPMPSTLQQLKTQNSPEATGVKGGKEGQMLEVNYQFQRWSGDHSVRISVPTEARREGQVTLLPSDARAADVLLRNMGQLTGLTPDLLRPQQERDEQQQQRRQQQQPDEDQE